MPEVLDLILLVLGPSLENSTVSYIAMATSLLVSIGYRAYVLQDV